MNKNLINTMKEIINKANKYPQNIPITGNVGQNVIGYFTDPYGRTFQIKPEPRGEEFVGPGSYSPNFISKKLKNSTFSKSKPKSSLILNNIYNSKIKKLEDKKIKKIPIFPRKLKNYKLKKKKLIDENKNINYNFKESNPKIRFPNIKFKNSINSRQFLSKEQRNLFFIKENLNNSTNLISKIQNFNNKKDNTSYIFKSHTERFQEINNTLSPSPTQYSTISNNNNFIKGHSFEPLFPEAEPLPKINSPGPGSYNNNISSIKVSINPHPIFNNKIPREILKPNEGPSPTDYNIKLPLKSKSILIHQKNNIPNLTWNQIKDTPGPGQYSINLNNKIIGGKIPKSNKIDLINKEEKSFEFNLVHNDFIKKSYNAKIYRSKSPNF